MRGEEGAGMEGLTISKVTVFNQSYRVTSADGGGRASRVAQLVDARMRETAAQITTHDVARIAVLTALRIADELLTLTEMYEAGDGTTPSPGEGDGGGPANDGDGSAQAPARGTWFESIFDSESAPPDSRGGRMGSSLSERLRTARQSETESDAGGDRSDIG